MADPIISPDGEWMWTGSDWIPAPPEYSPEEMQSENRDGRLNEIRLTLPEYRQHRSRRRYFRKHSFVSFI